MIVSLSLVLIIGAVAFLLYRYRALGPVAFGVVFVFGFLTAQTPAAEPIGNVITTIADTVTAIGG